MFTPVTLDKARNVSFGFGAMRMFKGMTGKSLTKVNFEEEDVEDLIPTMIYCGLKHEDPELTVEKTVELIDQYLGVNKTMELITQAFKNSGLSVEEKPGKN